MPFILGKPVSLFHAYVALLAFLAFCSCGSMTAREKQEMEMMNAYEHAMFVYFRESPESAVSLIEDFLQRYAELGSPGKDMEWDAVSNDNEMGYLQLCRRWAAFSEARLVVALHRLGKTDAVAKHLSEALRNLRTCLAPLKPQHPPPATLEELIEFVDIMDRAEKIGWTRQGV